MRGEQVERAAIAAAESPRVADRLSRLSLPNSSWLPRAFCLRKNVKVLLEQTHQASPTTFQNPPVLLMFQFPVRLGLDSTGPFQDLLLAVSSLSQRAERLSHKFTPPLHNQPFDKDVFSH